MKDADGYTLAYEEAERCRSLARFWRARLDELSDGWADRVWAVAEVKSLDLEASELDATWGFSTAAH